ncbi:MAG: hypothetical protein EAX86_01045 [Candidatus Heimdallarchaeota archaeon]|nr:hypothetical protein [Candidatus Heimdallarchaeota archaeon]
MKVKLKFLGSLQYDFKQQSIEYSLSNANHTLKDLLSELLLKQEFQLLRQYLSDNLELKRSLLIFINDQEISALDGINTKIDANTMISFIPVIHGGFNLFTKTALDIK